MLSQRLSLGQHSGGKHSSKAALQSHRERRPPVLFREPNGTERAVARAHRRLRKRVRNQPEHLSDRRRLPMRQRRPARATAAAADLIRRRTAAALDRATTSRVRAVQGEVVVRFEDQHLQAVEKQ